MQLLKRVQRQESPIVVRLPPEMKKEFEKWRLKLGQSKAGFAALCIEAGLKSVIRGVQPEEAMDEGKLVRLVGLLMKAQGIDLKKELKKDGRKQVHRT